MFRSISPVTVLFACLINASFLSAAHEKKTENSRGASQASLERKMLEQNCHSIIAQINARFAGFGGFDSSGRIQTIAQEVTRYLTSVGTPTARSLLKEYEQRGWNYIQ